MRRQAVWYAAAAAAGILTAYAGMEKGWLPALGAAAALSLLVCLGFGGKWTLLAAFAAGAAVMLLETAALSGSPLAALAGEQVLCRGMVMTAQEEETGLTLTVRVNRVRGAGEIRETVLVKAEPGGYGPEDLAGRPVQLTGTPELPREAGNPRTFDYRRYLKGRGIAVLLRADAVEVTGPPEGALCRLLAFLTGAREAFLDRVAEGPEERALAAGILFGMEENIGEDTLEAFRDNGTAHVLAVSGLHIGVLYGLFETLQKKRRSALLTAAFPIFLLLYGTAAMWPASVLRAVGIILLKLAAERLDRRFDLLSALAAVSLPMMLARPYIIFSGGFQMSFLAVLGMTFLIPRFKLVMKEGPAAALSVQAAILPYTAWAYNHLSPAGLLANVPVIFLTGLFVPLGMAGFFLTLAGASVPGPAAAALGALGRMTVWINEVFFAEGRLLQDVASPPLTLLAAGYGAALYLSSEEFAVSAFRRDRRRLGAAAGLLALAVLFAGWLDSTPFDRADAVFVDVGQGDCFHIRWGAEDILIDGGGRQNMDVGKEVLKPYLLKNRRGRVELALATHLHMDHFLGLQQLAAVYPVERLVTEGEAGERITFSEDRYIDILWPLERGFDPEDENDTSMVFLVADRGVRILVTGDLTEEGERALLARYEGTDALRADILKVGHHGSRFSTCDGFLAAVSPTAAVISVGKNNYGHPAPSVIEKMEENGIMVYRTDRDGAVGVIIRDGGYTICTQKGEGHGQGRTETG